MGGSAKGTSFYGWVGGKTETHERIEKALYGYVEKRKTEYIENPLC